MRDFLMEFKTVVRTIYNWNSLPAAEKKTYSTIAVLAMFFFVWIIIQKLSV